MVPVSAFPCALFGSFQLQVALPLAELVWCAPPSGLPPSFALHATVPTTPAPLFVTTAEAANDLPATAFESTGFVSASFTGTATVNADELVAVPFGVVTTIGPVPAPLGTWAVMSVSELTTKLVSGVPLKVTLVAPVKWVPCTSTVVPTGPPAGANDATVGTGGAMITW